MAGSRRGAARGAARGVALRAQQAQRQTSASSRATRSSTRQPAVPVIYREMLAEAGVSSRAMTSDEPERPLKRPRTGRRPPARAAAVQEAPGPTPESPESAEAATSTRRTTEAAKKPDASAHRGSEDEEDDADFEDVEIPKPTVQTAYLSSEDDVSEEEDIQFEDVEIGTLPPSEAPADDSNGTIRLDLTAAREAVTPSKRMRRQPITKAEKERRVEIHRMHLLCLLAHVEKRNHWCNDPVVQETIRTLLPAKTVQLLNPKASLSQFGQTESLKSGLKEAREIFYQRFTITERGMWRALWAENEKDLEEYDLPSNIENCLDKADFRKSAQLLKGSRDVGAQLFCALLRAVGVEARLVCSLQPLSFLPGGPTLQKPRKIKTPSNPIPVAPRVETVQPSPSTSRPSARARLGHPNATAYHIPDIPTPRSSSSTRNLTHNATPPIKESPFPIYWTEVLDIGHQKWQPVDVLVTASQFRPNKLEPPASDRANFLSYVIAFEEDGAAKDVTRRYAKAYNSKTRRMRIDGPSVPSLVEGAKWWRKALRRYKFRGPQSDLEQIESAELNAAEAREPMPRNVADFKDHPIYALERHLRRHEVLKLGAKVVGTVGAGSKGALEKIYRRRDVLLARSVDKWYRMGRIIKHGEDPVKVLPKRKPPKRKGRFTARDVSEESSSDEDPVLGIDPAKGNPLFTFDQTELYIPPPVVAGRVPKNKFGNLDAYVPSMVPAGGIQIAHPRAGHAAHILGVDYAPALTGFDWKGRKGTAKYNGVIIPVEAAEAVRAVLKGFEDLEAQMEEERRSRRALETWRSWLRTLRIRRRLFEGDEYWAGTTLEDAGVPEDEDMEDEGDDEVQQGNGGGFTLDEDDDDQGGSFEPGGFEPGGFEPEGFEPGGFEPGGFEPGGFEPGGFEPGGFEPTVAGVNVKGKGKDAMPPINLDQGGTEDEKTLSDFSVTRNQAGEEPGGFETQNDVEMVDQQTDTTHLGARERAADEEGMETTVPDLQIRAEVGNQEDPAVSNAEAVLLESGDAASDPRGSQDSEDVELNDAASDETEELFMDDDGSLID